MTGLMTVSTIAAVALAIVAAVLAVIAWRQRKKLTHLQDRDAPARPPGQGNDAARAMLSALREPALLHGERIEAVNDAFATAIGIPPAQLTGKTLAELVSSEYAELAALAVARAITGTTGTSLTEVEFADAHGQVTRIELSGSALESSGRRLVLFTAEEMLPHQAGDGTGLPPARSQLALDSLGEGILTTDAHGQIDYLNPSAEMLTGMRREDVVGQAFGAMIGFVDEHDRRALADPVQQCLATGSRVNLGRRSILISRASGNRARRRGHGFADPRAAGRRLGRSRDAA